LPNCLDLAALEAERDASWVDDRQPGVTRVVFVGHVKEAKGALDLATAARRIANDCVLELEFVGPFDADCRSRIEAAAAGVPLRVVFRDSRSHAWAMESVRCSHVLALPSHTEGFPNVVMEAMALGIPVLGTRVGAIAEMLEADGLSPCGLVVAPRDTEALSAALRRLVEDRELAKQMGAAGRRRFVANYSSSAVVGRLLELWTGAVVGSAAKSECSGASAGAMARPDCAPPCE
jgi:glycosyltransferase involved in cell wall biosynthesis